MTSFFVIWFLLCIACSLKRIEKALPSSSSEGGDGGEPRDVLPLPPVSPNMAPLGDPSDPRGDPRPTDWRQPISSGRPWARV